MSTDTLSDVLRAVRLTGAVFFDVHTRAPWVMEAPSSAEIAPLVMPGAGQVIEYHLITDGTCYSGLAGGVAHKLEAGDLIIFPQGDRHVLSDEPGKRAQPNIDDHQRPPGTHLPIRHEGGGDGASTSIICGFLGYDKTPFNPLIHALPRVVLIRKHQLSRRALAPLIQIAVEESRDRRAGSECALSRLSELLFVEAIRAYVETLSPEQGGWLSGLRDEHVGKALALIHDQPSRSWSIEDLAQGAGLSKSLLSERFAFFVGCPPMQYLAEWRMQLAAERLRSTNETMAEIAERIGYGSESAFSRAFKRLVGVAPATFRQNRPLGSF